MRNIFLVFVFVVLATGCVHKVVSSTGDIYGVVKDAKTSEPLKGCAVMLQPTGITMITGDNGTFNFKELTPDTYTIEASCYGYSTNKRSITVAPGGNTITVDILLNTSATSIYGTVKDNKTNAPLSGCSVTLLPMGMTITTGTDGAFRFNDIPAGFYSVEISCSGYLNNKKDIIINVGGEPVPVDITLNKSTTSIHGTVKDNVTNLPLSGCSVTLLPKGTTIVTDANGTFQFNDVEAGDYNIEVSCYGYFNNKRNVVINAGGNAVLVDISLGKSVGTVYGIIKDNVNNQPLSGCSVTLMPIGATITTGADGVFQFNDVIAGTYSVETSCNGYFSNKKNVIINEGTTSVPVDIFLVKATAGSVYGMVKDNTTNQPLEGCSVLLLPIGTTVTTGTDGIFQFKDLEAGNYSIKVSRQDYHSNSKNITIDANQSTSSMDILLTRSTGTLHGVVKNAETFLPLEGSSVTLRPTGTNLVTGADGLFCFESLAPGTYSIEASCLGYLNNTFANISVKAGDDAGPIEVLLETYDPNNRLAKMGTLKVSEITFKSAKLECSIVEHGSTSVTERGFLYSESPYVTLNTATKQVVNTTQDLFSVTLNNLVQQTDYYVAAYATNGRGTAYSDVVKFTTENEPIIPAPTPMPDNVICVSVSGNDANSGTSWIKAKKTIKAALEQATKQKQIWVSVGTYDEMLEIKNGVNIFGGFKGNETTTDGRNSKTVIRGIKNTSCSTQTIVDGFQMIPSATQNNMMIGGYISLSNCIIGDGKTYVNGSIYFGGTSTKVNDCIIEWVDMSFMINCVITMTNCIFRGNTHSLSVPGYLTMYNCILTNNATVFSSIESINLYNCTLANNKEIFSKGKKANLYNCLIWNNSLRTEDSQYSCIYVQNDNNSNVKLKRPSTTIGPNASDWKTADWSIGAGSSCINAGNIDNFPYRKIQTDISGNKRISGSSIDVGAYEYQN
ncbi:MAG: carboxypeptidase regulatory-like domain-containing protein [Odoribacter sp.]|nr:carboxypeptidase regulatory-like domain-containing protein [Odoribacter sp.]